uniref:PHD-type domain-containing protein n=1 Tax=Strongyloides venezuelensis TaxID=75913 RepID=A0A0K0FFC0_STRVS
MNVKGNLPNDGQCQFMTKKKKLLLALEVFTNESIKEYHKEFCSIFGLIINKSDSFKFGFTSGLRKPSRNTTPSEDSSSLEHWDKNKLDVGVKFYSIKEIDDFIDYISETEESALVQICIAILNDPDFKAFVDTQFKVILHRNCQLKKFIVNIFKSLQIDYDGLNRCFKKLHNLSQQPTNYSDIERKKIHLQILALLNSITMKLKSISELYGARIALLEEFNSKLAKQKIKLTNVIHDVDEELRDATLNAWHRMATDMTEENEVFKLFSKYSTLKKMSEMDISDFEDDMDVDEDEEDETSSSINDMECDSENISSTIQSPECFIDIPSIGSVPSITPIASPKSDIRIASEASTAKKKPGKIKKTNRGDDDSDGEGQSKRIINKGKKANQLDLATLAEMNAAPDEPRYCLCDRVSYGDMVGCDNEKCTLEWFHFECVGLRSKPKGKWYCPLCRDDKPTSLRKIKS